MTLNAFEAVSATADAHAESARAYEATLTMVNENLEVLAQLAKNNSQSALDKNDLVAAANWADMGRNLIEVASDIVSERMAAGSRLIAELQDIVDNFPQIVDNPTQ